MKKTLKDKKEEITLTEKEIKKGYKMAICPRCGKVYKQKYLWGVESCAGIINKMGKYYRCNAKFRVKD